MYVFRTQGCTVKQTEQKGYEPWETVFPEGLEMVPPRFAIVHRNRWMVHEADMVIAYVTHDWGGAAKMVVLAEKKGKKIVRI